MEGSYPEVSSKTTPFFPPVCLKYHWDPTVMLRHIVPQGPSLSLPLDPRPWTKICLEYVNSGQASEQAPPVPSSVVFPPGGEFYPPTRWSQNIDNDSLTRRLDRPLGTCDNVQYEPPANGDMYVSSRPKPSTDNFSYDSGSSAPTPKMLSELAMPRTLLTVGGYKCTTEGQQAAWDRSPYLFNNATKQQKYNQGFQTKQLKPVQQVVNGDGNGKQYK